MVPALSGNCNSGKESKDNPPSGRSKSSIYWLISKSAAILNSLWSLYISRIIKCPKLIWSNSCFNKPTLCLSLKELKKSGFTVSCTPIPFLLTPAVGILSVKDLFNPTKKSP